MQHEAHTHAHTVAAAIIKNDTNKYESETLHSESSALLQISQVEGDWEEAVTATRDSHSAPAFSPHSTRSAERESESEDKESGTTWKRNRRSLHEDDASRQE